MAEELEQFSLDEVANHNTNKSAWIVIGNKIYDITKFLDEHPGGSEVLLEKAGEDATEAFEDVGHSTDARTMKEEFLIGQVIEEERKQYSYDKKSWATTSTADNRQRSDDSSPFDNMVYFALIAVIVALVYYLLLN